LPNLIIESSRLDRWLARITLGVHRNPARVLALAAIFFGVTWGYASGLRIRGDFVLLLPSKSETAQRFRAALARKGSDASTLVVLAESEHPDHNRRFVDALAERLRRFPSDRIGSVETGPAAAREFFERWRWLFADVADLTRVECELELEQARHNPAFVDLGEACGAAEGPKTAGASGGAANASPLRRLRDESERRRKELDRYPTGYYRTEDGLVYALVLRLPMVGLGDDAQSALFDAVQAEVRALDPASFSSELKVGYGGDVPNAIAEKDALIADVTLVSGLAVILIALAIAIFFRSVAAVPIVAVSVFVASGAAFAVGRLAYQHLNAATSFLGAIIAGNGINYSILYLARYRERRSLGDDPKTALVDAALTSRGATWLAAVASGGAYAALTLTNFRGFSEFGLIGGTGMILCWVATFAVTPAAITLYERWQGRRGVAQASALRPLQPRVFRLIGRVAQRRPKLLLALAVAVTLPLAWRAAVYLADPWEYDFGKLGSRSSAERGAGYWSVRADRVFASRGSPILVLANDMSEALPLATEITARDRKLTGGKYVEQISTIHDRLGGAPEVVAHKLELLRAIRAHIDRTHKRLSGEDARIAAELRPPEYLRALTPGDLPPLVRAQFTEKNGTVGTPVYVHLNRGISQSKGQHLLAIAEVLDGVRLPDGSVAASASRASIFAEMIRSMARDGPLCTALAFLVVVFAAVVVTRRALPSVTIVVSLVCGVIWTIGWAESSDIRLNFVNFVALPLTFGIGVDYAINLFERVRFSHGDVVEGTASVGGVVFLCSLTTILGYGSLLFADNRALQSFGRYAIRGEIACSLAALLVVPAALALFGRRQKP
jgi:uncharacterized protein